MCAGRGGAVYGLEPGHERTAERLFERRWTLALLENILARLESEMIGAGKAEFFAQLRPMLEGDGPVESYRKIATTLSMSEGAVKVAAHGLQVPPGNCSAQDRATVADPACPMRSPPRSPAASAALMIERPVRSLIDPPGFTHSILR